MSTNTPNEKGTPQSRTYTVNDMVPSTFMRKFICRLRLNEVSRQ